MGFDSGRTFADETRCNSRSRTMEDWRRTRSLCGQRSVSCPSRLLLCKLCADGDKGQLEWFERQGEGFEVKQQYLAPAK